MKNLYAASMPCCAKVQDGMHEKVLGHEKHFWYEKHLRRHAVLYKRSRRQERRGMTYFQFIHEVEVKVREETEGPKGKYPSGSFFLFYSWGAMEDRKSVV